MVSQTMKHVRGCTVDVSQYDSQRFTGRCQSRRCSLFLFHLSYRFLSRFSPGSAQYFHHPRNKLGDRCEDGSTFGIESHPPEVTRLTVVSSREKAFRTARRGKSLLSLLKYLIKAHLLRSHDSVFCPGFHRIVRKSYRANG